MALQRKITTTLGITVEEAYSRVDTISGYKGSINITVNSYTTKSSYMEGNSYIQQDQYTFTPSVLDSSTNIFKQAYEYLKTLDNFKDATDVLETSQTA